MKFLLNLGIESDSKLHEIACMRLAAALRNYLGFNKKLVILVVREMRNGALWLCYTVDGVKCSTFARAQTVARLAAEAPIEQTAINYALAFVKKFYPAIDATIDTSSNAFINPGIIIKIDSLTSYKITASLADSQWHGATTKGRLRSKSSELGILIKSLLGVLGVL